MKKLLSTIALLAAIGMSAAMAEEVTIDLPFKHQGQECIDLSNGTMKKFSCVFVAEDEQTMVNGTDNSDSNDAVADEEVDEETDPYLKTFQDYIDRNQLYIDNLKEQREKGQTTNLENETIEAFDNLKLCSRGVNESQPIQNYETYIITWHELPDLKSIDLHKSGKLVTLVKKGLECKYQWEILHPTILGPRYLHLSIEAARPEITYHAQIANALETHPSQPLGDKSSEAIKAERLNLCQNTAYSVQFRSDYGCGNIYDYPEWEGKQAPKQGNPYEYYTPMMKLEQWKRTDGHPDLNEYKAKNKDNINLHVLANSLGVDLTELQKFLESQK